MTRGEAINWIINLTADIGKMEHQDLWHYEQALEEIRDMIEAMPLEQPEWIPCSERLPDTDDHVLVTTINKRGDRRVVRAYYYRSDDYPGGGAWAAGMNNNVIAWMPLPEPYREGEKS